MSDFYFAPNARLDFGTGYDRFENNQAAIKLVKLLETEEREATADEQDVLSRYVGWGDASVNRYLYKLEETMTEAEFRAARQSALNAHYTDLPIVGAMWTGMERLGLLNNRLRVIDPAAGIGHFKSKSPVTARLSIDWTEVELDPITASILKYLHPESRVLSMGYEATGLPEVFDLAISNVPFGNVGVFSKRDMPKVAKKSIHDFFFCNTYHVLKPGGIMAFITSRFTMDKKDATVRKWLAERFDLLSAVRLPYTTFKHNAGTQVITDVLIMQKRSELATVMPEWVNVGEFLDTRRTTYVNHHYINHPEFVLGKQSNTGEMYQSDGYNVEPHPFGDMEVFQLMERAYESLKPIDFEAVKKEYVPREDTVIVVERESNPVTDGLMEIYKAAKTLIKAEIAGKNNVEQLRKDLNDVYLRFFTKYGSITKNLKKLEGGEAYFLAALELDGGLRKADIFNKPTTRTARKLKKLTASDALLVSLDTVGKVDLDLIGKSLKMTPAQVLEELGDTVYHDPVAREWQTAQQYLSGNVREKLIDAKAAAVYEKMYERNVPALEGVIPADVEIGQIRVPLGAGWVPSEYVESFMIHLIGGREEYSYNVHYIEVQATWTLSIRNWYMIRTADMSSKWGTSRMDTTELMMDGLNSKTPQVFDGSLEDRVLNTTETVAAQQKLLEIKEEWEKWLWSDETRAKVLHRLYNDKFNSLVNVPFDGSHLSTPGLAKEVNGEEVELRSNQSDVAWRAIQRQATLIGHEVGMGKTLSLIVAIMEAKRLGLIKKAMIVVPNHLIPNWTKALLDYYPGSNWLLPTAKDLSKANRSKFMSTIATNDWDGVLVPFTSFKMLPVSNDLLNQYFQDQLDELHDALMEAREDNAGHKVVKEIEKTIKRIALKLEKLQDFQKDSEAAITWEELGIDMLCVDEFHAFKNLFFVTKMTRVAGLTNSESQRAMDMFIKFAYTIDKGGKVVGMTGTPITNTIAEMFTMQRFFQMLELKNVGLAQFDAWARQYALAEPGLEMTPDGSGFRMNTRFRKFVNVPELMKQFLSIADMRRINPESTEIVRPALWRGKPVKVVVSAGQDLEDFVQELAARAEKVRSGRVPPTEDNMLKIVSEGRKAALDLSLVKPAVAGAPMPKLDKLAELAKKIYDLTSKVKGTQLVFCDLGTPKAKNEKLFIKAEADGETEESEVVDTDTEAEKSLTHNVYNEIKMRMVKQGIPADEIVYIHSATTSSQRAALERDVNSGKIRVLLGSNEKMGTGLNVQERLIAIHQITPPWRPGDIEQQVGRMWRQGNKWPQVFQFVHVTEKSFDGYIWQLLENKAGFIAQIMNGSVQDREMDDIGEAVLTFTEIKGLASGNPKVMQKIVLDTEVARMGALFSSWKTSKFQLRQSIKHKQILIEADTKTRAEIETALKIRNEHQTDEFEILLADEVGADEVKWVKETDKDKAGSRLLMLGEMASTRVIKSAVDRFPIAIFKGHTIYATATSLFKSTPGESLQKTTMYFNMNGLITNIASEGPKGTILSITAIMRNLDEKYEKLRRAIADNQTQITQIEAELNSPWDFQEKYDRLVAELTEINKELQATDENPESGIVEATVQAKTAQTNVRDAEDALEDIKLLMSKDTTLLRFAAKADPVQVPVAQAISARKAPAAKKEAPVVKKVPLVDATKGMFAQMDDMFSALLDAPDDELEQADMFAGLFG